MFASNASSANPCVRESPMASAELFSAKKMMGRSALQQHLNPTGARDARFQSGAGIGNPVEDPVANAFPSRPLSSAPKGCPPGYPGPSVVGPHKSPNLNHGALSGGDDTGYLKQIRSSTLFFVAAEFFTVGIRAMRKL